MVATKSELSVGRRRLFQLIIERARIRYLRMQNSGVFVAGVVARDAPQKAGTVTKFFDMAQDSFNFRH